MSEIKNKLNIAIDLSGEEDYGILKPGEYGKLGDTWYCHSPNGHHGNLTNHEIIEHEDGTITVKPSILIGTTDATKERNRVVLFHGFLERGVWREC